MHETLVSASQKGLVMVENSRDSVLFDDRTIAADGTHVIPVASSAPGDFLQRLSHEMRTPLSAILGFAQLMDTGTPSPTVSQKRSIAMILQAGWHLDNLINMTRDLAAIESGALAVSLTPVSLAAVVGELQSFIEHQARTRGVRMKWPRVDPACLVAADRIRLKQALVNLLSAAIENSVADTTLVLRCAPQSTEWIRFDITDGGADMLAQPPERLEVPPVDGTAIGLLLARRLIELMDGSIVAASRIGTHRTFSFDLKRLLAPPIAVDSTAIHAPASKTPAASAVNGYLT